MKKYLIPKSITIEYLYRDAGNFKLFGDKTFSNKTKIDKDTIIDIINRSLMEGIYFMPEKWGLKRLRFHYYLIENDHPWHELENILFDTEIDFEEDISDLFKKLK
jgi:hypothetical protein